jgi:hypothetical protein
MVGKVLHLQQQQSEDRLLATATVRLHVPCVTGKQQVECMHYMIEQQKVSPAILVLELLMLQNRTTCLIVC